MVYTPTVKQLESGGRHYISGKIVGHSVTVNVEDLLQSLLVQTRMRTVNVEPAIYFWRCLQSSSRLVYLIPS